MTITNPNYVEVVPAGFIPCDLCNEGLVECMSFDADGNLARMNALCAFCQGTGIYPEPDPQNDGDNQADLLMDGAA